MHIDISNLHLDCYLQQVYSKTDNPITGLDLHLLVLLAHQAVDNPVQSVGFDAELQCQTVV